MAKYVISSIDSSYYPGVLLGLCHRVAYDSRCVAGYLSKNIFPHRVGTYNLMMHNNGKPEGVVEITKGKSIFPLTDEEMLSDVNKLYDTYMVKM